MTNTNLAMVITPPPNNLIEVDFTGTSKRRTTSLFKSDGNPKATPADPLRNLTDIKAMQKYFLDNNKIRDYTLFTVGILFGLRAGDLLNLRIHHIMKPNGTFKTHCDLIESKTRKFNNPVITPQVQKLLTDYLETMPDYKYDDPLFRSRQRNKDGKYEAITLRQANRILKKAAEACNIGDHISSHSLRKTFAYQLLKQNPNDDNAKFALQRMLNHRDFKTTLNYCGMTQDSMDIYRAELEGGIL